MERLFFRERQQHSDGQRGTSKKGPIEQMHIGVTGLGRSVGTTFVATALAFYFREKEKDTAFCQCLTPSKASRLSYDEVAMEQRFGRRAFCDVYGKIAAGEPLVGGLEKTSGKLNVEERINWILPVPGSTDLTEVQRSRLVTIPKGEIRIFDFQAEDEWNPLLLDMDWIVVVVDPLPSKLIRSKKRFHFLKKLELSGCKVIWVVNRNNPGVSLRQVKAYLKTNQAVLIPDFGSEIIYRSEYSCKFAWENGEIQRKMMEIFTLLF